MTACSTAARICAGSPSSAGANAWKAWSPARARERIDLSPLLSFASGEELAALRAAPPEPEIEGLMLKRWDSVYEPGRPKGRGSNGSAIRTRSMRC